MGGMAVVRAVRDAAAGEDTNTPATVILADRDADGFLAGRAGADCWLRKPFGGFELRDAVERLIDAGGAPS
jgi:DNA-binding response OmpR family regulator